jgi:hypothetical protein
VPVWLTTSRRRLNSEHGNARPAPQLNGIDWPDAPAREVLPRRLHGRAAGALRSSPTMGIGCFTGEM